MPFCEAVSFHMIYIVLLRAFSHELGVVSQGLVFVTGAMGLCGETAMFPGPSIV